MDKLIREFNEGGSESEREHRPSQPRTESPDPIKAFYKKLNKHAEEGSMGDESAESYRGVRKSREVFEYDPDVKREVDLKNATAK